MLDDLESAVHAARFLDGGIDSNGADARPLPLSMREPQSEPRSRIPFPSGPGARIACAIGIPGLIFIAAAVAAYLFT